MPIDERLERLFALLLQGSGKILVVDQAFSTEPEVAVADLIDLEATLAQKYHANIQLVGAAPQDIPLDNYDCIVCQPVLPLVNIQDFLRSLRPLRAAYDSHANTPTITPVLKTPEHPNFKGLRTVMNALGLANSYERLVLTTKQADTAVDWLYATLTQSWHEYCAFLDTRFKDHLSDAFSHFTLQRDFGKIWLIVSNRQAAAGRSGWGACVRVIPHNLQAVSNHEMDEYIGIIVDNDWDHTSASRLGIGIETLESLPEVDIPIIYQSAHPRDEFTDEELARISARAIFMPKHTAFKLCAGEDAAKKELAVSELCQADPHLTHYIAHVQRMGPQGVIGAKNLFIVASSAARPPARDDEKIRVLAQAGIAQDRHNDLYVHRMYVLARLHTLLQDQIHNPVFTENNPVFIDVRGSGGLFSATTMQVYDRITQNSVHYEKRTISHNDAQPGNWFRHLDRSGIPVDSGLVLGDFSNACARTECSDIVRSRLEIRDMELKTSVEEVCRSANDYAAIRSVIDSGYKPLDGFAKLIHESLIAEAVRLAIFARRRNNFDGHYAYVRFAEFSAQSYADRYLTPSLPAQA